MGTGYRGTFVISWSQTSMDGLAAAPVCALGAGVAWAWQGEAVRVDGPSGLLQLDRATGETQIRRRAARMVRRLVGAALGGSGAGTWADAGPGAADADRDPLLADSAFVVTDGRSSWTVTLIEVGGGARPLLMFLDDIPPCGADLWVVHATLAPRLAGGNAEQDGGVICFTPGTRILTPDGQRPVEDLREGDAVQTKDSGAQRIHWTGRRRMTGARLFAMPKLRPICIRAGALGLDCPDKEFLVSPGHRMLVTGDVARALFNTSEVLVAARDLVNGATVTRDSQLREVTYVHLMLPRHEIVFANGVETESFHPASTALSTLDDADRARLLQGMPQIAHDPARYGGYARRSLTRPEAALLLHEAA